MHRASPLLFFALVACKPDLPERESIVASERVLAIRAEPAEAAPGEAVAYTALVASPGGTASDALVQWSFCGAPKPPGENGSIASACARGDDLRALGTTNGRIDTTVPDDACALFGPDAPPGGYRPADPDVTGGYYQPVLARTTAETSSYLARVACNLANAPAAIASDFGRRYVKNKNPVVRAASIPDRVAPGARVDLAVSWDDADAERYVVFDAASQSIVDKREAMRVSWFATAGDFDDDRTGRAEDDPATESANGWTAPSASGVVHVWVVLRDSRGGVGFVAKDVVVGSP